MRNILYLFYARTKMKSSWFNLSDEAEDSKRKKPRVLASALESHRSGARDRTLVSGYSSESIMTMLLQDIQGEIKLCCVCQEVFTALAWEERLLDTSRPVTLARAITATGHANVHWVLWKSQANHGRVKAWTM